jgi:hypothetical protein
MQVKSFKGIDYITGKTCSRNYACQLSPYLKNEKVLRCPADIPGPLMYRRNVYITSYCWNSAVLAFNESQQVTINGNAWRATLKLGQFKADDILIWENDELRVDDGEAWCDTFGYPTEGISGRHGKGATVGNADGSAERILLRTYYMMAANQTTRFYGNYWDGAHKGQPIPNRLWCNPLRADGAW